MNRTPACLILGPMLMIALLVAGLAAPKSARAQPYTHADAIALTNGQVDIAVSPDVGRIVAFGRTGGDNLLWVPAQKAIDDARAKDQWANFGGDKVWPALQAIWPRFVPSGGGWPPDRIIDGQPWTVLDQSDRHVTIQSRINPDLNAKVTRRIELVADQPAVRITNTLERVGPSVLPVMIWTVSNVPHPDYTLMALAADRPANERDHPFVRFSNKKDIDNRVEILDGAVRFNVTTERSLKTGTLGPWVAGVWPDTIFAQYTTFDPAGSYPDRSCSQVYCDGNYVELELLSPQRHLQPGESMTLDVTWRLLTAPADAGITDTAAVIRHIEAHAPR